MDLSSTKSYSTTISETGSKTSLGAKLRRLKIEENILLQSINKCVPDCSQVDNEVNATSYKIFTDFKTFFTKTKESYRQIKLTFEDIRTSIFSKEMLEALEIADIKRSTLDLENKIKSFKLNLQSELINLKSAEKQLNQSLSENPISISKLKRQPRIQTATYNEIVPSPVKTLMTSPFKCLEVQEFQEFMMNSTNRYGGWNEYHHNIFVNHWQKYFGSENNSSLEDLRESPLQNSTLYNLFLRDLVPKLHGIRDEEVNSHINWYIRYLYLKERQQKAIDKWRLNRKMMKSAKAGLEVTDDSTVRNNTIKRKSFVKHSDINSIVSDELTNMSDLLLQSQPGEEVRGFVRKCFSDEVKLQTKNKTGESSNYNLYQAKRMPTPAPLDDDLRFRKSTKQWNIRINSKIPKADANIYNFENIQKLRVPTWRLGL